MAGWDTYKIKDVVGEIADQTFVLPVVQRRFVWEPEKIELLFDTLLKGDAFGGIMVLEEEAGQVPLFESRPFSAHGEIIPSLPTRTKLTKRTLFVIDGQQRLQSLYLGLFGRLDARVLHFDLFSDSRTFFDFRFAREADSLPQAVRDNEPAEKRPILERCWYPIPPLFDRLKRAGGALETVLEEMADEFGGENREKAKAVRANVTAFWSNVFSNKRLGVDSVCLNSGNDALKNRQRVVELFRRLNDGGTPLSSYDLFASLLKGFNWRMEAFLDEMLREHGSMGLTQDNLIKLVFILQGDSVKEMDSISAADADFAVRNQEKIKRALELTQSFLEAAKLKDYYGSGNRSFIPLFFIAYYVFHKDAAADYFNNFDTHHRDFKSMRDWLFHSLLNSVFKSRGVGWNPAKTGVARILEVMQGAKQKGFPLADLLVVYRSHLHRFSTEYRPEDLDKLDRDFAFYVIYDCKRAISGRDIDHIQPRSKLEDLKKDPEKINSLANFQLLDTGTNRGPKNDALFDAWLNGSGDDGPHVVDRPGFLKRHLIPVDVAVHEIANFDRLILERGQLIAAKLNETFQS